LQKIIRSILQKLHVSEELALYIYAIILAKTHPPKDLDDLKVFWRYGFEGLESRNIHSALLQSPLDMLKGSTMILATMEFFTNSYTQAFLGNQVNTPQLRVPLTPFKTLRLQRALLRFQL